jgi:hypothetical protein
MAVTITKKQRQEVEERTYKVMDILDPSKVNSEYYKKLFASMSDAQFAKYMAKKFPYKFHITPNKIEPTVDDAEKALNYLGTSFIEKVYMPYVYKNKDGVPVTTLECMTGYIHIPKMQQMIVKKNKNSIDIDNRDISGRLIGDDKGAANTDREAEGLAALGFMHTMDELSRFRADDMQQKNVAYNTIKTKGVISKRDLVGSKSDPLARQLMNTYMIGAHINSNLVHEGYYTPYTLKTKQKNIARQ